MRPAAVLLLTAALADEILEHARAELPNEACGLLAGDASTGVATAFHAARNAEASAYAFSMHAEDLVRIVYAIEAAGDDMLAIFHSHPRSASVPSASDLREARYPAALHLVAGLGAPDASRTLRAWRIDGGECVEVPLRIEDSISSRSPR